MRAAALHDLDVLKRSAQEGGHTLEMYHFQELSELIANRPDGQNTNAKIMQELGDMMQHVKMLSMAREMPMDMRLELCELLKTAFKVMRVWLKEGME